MKVTEHEMRGLLTGKCVPGNMKVNEELPAYLVRQFAALHEQVQQLAAECSANREITKRVISMLAMSGYNPVKDSLNPAEALLFDAEQALETPATDAWLNEVRAHIKWPEATARDREGNWSLNCDFIWAVEARAQRIDSDFTPSVDGVQTVLIAAAEVLPEFLKARDGEVSNGNLG